MSRPGSRTFLMLAVITLGCRVHAKPLNQTPAIEVLSFRVRVYNYESAPDADLLAARGIADGVFRDVGLRAVWQDCTIGSPNRDSLACDTYSTQIDLTLYLVARLEDHAPYVRRNALGYSIIPNDGGLATMAYVCFGRVRRLRTAFRPGELLGLAIAHEIGHLLLGTNGHSNYGLMRASWARRALEAGDWNDFRFTSEQAKRLRTAILARIT